MGGQLHHQGKSFWYPMNGRVGWTQRVFGSFRKKENLIIYHESNQNSSDIKPAAKSPYYARIPPKSHMMGE